MFETEHAPTCGASMRGRLIDAEHLALQAAAARLSSQSAILSTIEREAIVKVLRELGGTKAKSARCVLD